MIKDSALKISLFGVPGAGKGTQAKMISKHFKVPSISTGDMFRAMESDSSPLARKVKGILNSGKLVPDQVVTEMVFNRLDLSDCDDGFLLDGFPRTMIQARGLQSSIYAVDHFIEIKVGREEIERRLSGRRVCSSCAGVFHVDDFEGGGTDCPKCKGKLVQRKDDAIDSVRTRLDLFESNVAPLLSFFGNSGRLRSIDGSGSPQLVFKRILDSIENPALRAM